MLAPQNGGDIMKRLLLAASLAALYLTSSAAFADDRREGRRVYYYHDHDDYHEDDDDDRHYYHHRHEHKRKGKRHRECRRGERIEVVYMEPRYYVEDYRHHHLDAPPPGHRWVRHPDGRYLLVAVASGIIADILLHH